MTTALIGKMGATTAKARVAVVSRHPGSALADAVRRTGHEVAEFVDWVALTAAGPESMDLVLYEDDVAADLPDTLELPAILIADRTSPNARGNAGTMQFSAVEAGLEPLLALAVELRMATRRCLELEALAGGVRSGNALVGRSPVMRRLQGAISRAADCDATVLLEGPAGSGKSLAARIVHCKSRRSTKPLRMLEAASLDADQMANVLDEARGGTLVVEDIDRLPAAAQAVLVRHLKDRSSARMESSPRLIATTSAHLPELVARGAFREDLYYRLNAFPMVVPALRERVEDIASIAEAFLATGAAQTGRSPLGFTPSAVILLESMSWPGNVAQLESVVRRAQAMAAGSAIDRDHLVAQAPAPGAPSPVAATSETRTHDVEAELTEDSIRPFEEEEQLLLSRALRATKGNVRRAAQLLGIGRATLYRKIQQYKLRLQ